MQKKSSDAIIIKQAEMQLTEWSMLKTFIEKKDLSLAYKAAERNAWIIQTLRDKKFRWKFGEAHSLVMVGCGYYPYSMFDVHKQYSHIKQVGLDTENSCIQVCNKLLGSVPGLGDDIQFKHCNGLDYDYSNLEQEDLVFLSVDITDSDEIFKKVIQTSRAQIFICAPYVSKWLSSI